MSRADPIPISAIEHYDYCPRQSALILVDGVWVDNRATFRGDQGHRRVDSGERRMERARLVVRSVPLWSTTLNLTGRADVVEIEADGTLVPVEYKMGTRHGLTADLQLCAEALCLEEMTGTAISRGAIWYSGPRRRHPVRFDDSLISATLAAIEGIEAIAASRRLPEPVDDARCPNCQLHDHCLPGIVANQRRVDGYLARLFDPDTEP